jgi:hypothetical protein
MTLPISYVIQHPGQVEFVVVGDDYDAEEPVDGIVVRTFGCDCCSERVFVHEDQAEATLPAVFDAIENRLRRQLSRVQEMRKTYQNQGYDALVNSLKP